MSFCKNCGAELKEGSRFCQKCGMKIESKNENTVKEEFNKTPIPENTVSSSKPNTNEYETKNNMKEPARSPESNKKPSMGLIIGIIAIVIIGVIAAVIFSKKGNKSTATAETIETKEVETTESGNNKTQPETVSQVETAIETEAETESKSIEEQIIGYWTGGGGRFGIEISKEGDCYLAQGEGSGSAFSSVTERMTCNLGSDERLYCSDWTLIETMYDNAGNQAEITEYTDGEGFFYITDEYPEDDYSVTVYAKEWGAGKEWGDEDYWTADTYLVWVPTKDNHYLSEEYMIWYSSDLVLDDYSLSMLTKDELRIARNEIFARHGRKFSSADLQERFNSCSWYNGTIEPNQFNESVLSQIEKDNVKIIESYENQSQNGGSGEDIWKEAKPYINQIISTVGGIPESIRNQRTSYDPASQIYTLTFDFSYPEGDEGSYRARVKSQSGRIEILDYEWAGA